MHQENIWNLIAKKLSGESSPEDLRDLEDLLRKNPELHYSLQHIMDLWHSEHSNFEKQEARDAFSKHVERMQQLDIDYSVNENIETTGNTSHKKKRVFIIAAVALPFFIVTFFLGAHFFSSSQSSVSPIKSTSKESLKAVSEIATKNGSKTNIILPDGTKVWLNAGSNLTYDSSYGKSIREVSLSGEGFFDVVKNKEKPFIIHAASINIKVLGTEFNVKSYPSEKTTEASLIRGSIEVTFRDKPNKTVILKPNEKIVVDNIKKVEAVIQSHTQNNEVKVKDVADGFAVKNLTYESKTGDVIETSWVDNKLIFQDESFDDIARQLERWYGVSINFENGQLKENHLTGSFKNETIRQALDALKFTATFNYSIDNNNNITIY